MTTRSILIQARNSLSDPSSWGKGIEGRDRPTGTRCLIQAIDDAANGDLRLRHAAREALKQQISGRLVVPWNDDPSRTHADVVAALDRAIGGTV